MTGPDRLTLREAAKALGLSMTSIRRRIREGTVEAHLVAGPFGDRWEIPRDVVERLKPRNGAGGVPHGAPMESLGAGTGAGGAGESRQESRNGAPWSGWSPPVESIGAGGAGTEDAGSRIGAPLEPLEWVEPLDSPGRPRTSGIGAPWSPLERVESGGEAAPSAKAVPIEAHLAALRMLEEERTRAGEAVEEARRLERQHMALGYELRKYQAALEANASSLVEREARAQEAEAKAREAEAHLVEARRQATEAEARARLVDEERERRLEAEAKAARIQENLESLQVELEEEQADAKELARRVKAEQVELGEAQQLSDMAFRRVEEEAEGRKRAEEKLEAQAAHLVEREQELEAARHRVEELEAAGKRPWWKRMFS